MSTPVYNSRGKRIATQEMVDLGEAPAWALGCEIPEISPSATRPAAVGVQKKSTPVYNARGKRVATQEMVDLGEAPAWALGCEIPEISPSCNSP